MNATKDIITAVHTVYRSLRDAQPSPEPAIYTMIAINAYKFKLFMNNQQLPPWAPKKFK